MPTASHTRWSGPALGLSIDSAFSLPGLQRGLDLYAGEHTLQLELAPADSPPGGSAGERLCEWHDERGEASVAIDRHDSGYRFAVAGHGVYELSADGSRAVCRPAPSSGWAWRRYLIGQVLPFAALLQGFEVFHASAVEFDGSVVAFSGPSGVGKSTLAFELRRAGAGFVTDDVLALERAAGRVVAHPGLGTVKLRRSSEAGLLEWRRPVVATSGPLPLETFCLLERAARGDLEVAEVAPDPRHLLGSTFNLLVATAERLSGHLDLCAAIARQARIVRVSVPPWPDAAAAARLQAALGAGAPAVA